MPWIGRLPLVAGVSDLAQLGLSGRAPRVGGRDDGAGAANVLGVGDVGPVVHHRRKSLVERGLTLGQARAMVEVQDDRDRHLLRQGRRQRRQRAQSCVRD
jgi:hypothetical protein